MRLRIASRGSPLAMAQARRVEDGLRSARPGLETEIVAVATTGDIDRRTSVALLTEVGAFVRAVQQEVMEGRADLAVHSCKDLPVSGPSPLRSFYPERESPWDVLCGASLEGLREGDRVGTGSPRRAAQLRLLRPDVEVCEIRGNVDTRLRAVEEGRYRAVVLAEAGIRRLGLEAMVDHRFGPEEMVPAPGQGALAVEAVEGSEAARMLEEIERPEVRSEVESERRLLALTGAGCRSALGAHASATGGGITATAFVDDDRGPRRASVTATTPYEVAAALRKALEL